MVIEKEDDFYSDENSSKDVDVSKMVNNNIKVDMRSEN